MKRTHHIYCLAHLFGHEAGKPAWVGFELIYF
jgi:hypothetical protein